MKTFDPLNHLEPLDRLGVGAKAGPNHHRRTALLSHESDVPSSAPILQRGARAALVGLLKRIRHGQLTIVEPGNRPLTFGQGRRQARLEIHDPKAWVAVASEGSIGFGRGYFEQWWTSDDPVAVIELLIDNLDRLEPWKRRKAALVKLKPRRVPRSLARRTAQDRDDISAHYDIGVDFFSQFLDPTLTYSSGVFLDPQSTLTEASIHKYNRLLDKLNVNSDDRILEIGSGWGGFAIHASSTRGCHVTTTTISHDQYHEVVRRAKVEQLGDKITPLRSDWRQLTGQFDKIVSIEMIEAVDWREYDHYFAQIETCLRPGGMAGIQAICIPGQRYETAKYTEDFIRRFIFPGGGLPSVAAIANSVAKATNLHLTDIEDLSAHYSRTLELWRSRFGQATEDLTDLGFDNRFQRLWDFYLAYCQAAFSRRHCTLNQIVLTGRDWHESGLTIRPH